MMMQHFGLGRGSLFFCRSLTNANGLIKGIFTDALAQYLVQIALIKQHYPQQKIITSTLSNTSSQDPLSALAGAYTPSGIVTTIKPCGSILHLAQVLLPLSPSAEHSVYE